MVNRLLFARLFVIATVLLPKCDAFFFFFGQRQCRSDPTTERCGLFGWAIVQHDGTPGTDSCQRRCIYFESSQLECGGCDIDEEITPPTVPSAPISTETPVQTLPPTPAPLQNIAPTPFATVAPIPVTVSSPESEPVTLSIPVPTSAPSPVPMPVLFPVSLPVPIPVPLPVSVPVPISVPIPVPIKVPIPVPIPVPIKVPIPIPVPLPVTFPVPVSLPSNYNIDLNLVGISETDRTFFTNAKARWESIVRGDLEGFRTTGLDRPSRGCTYPVTVDDIYICSRFVPIDGQGRVLGSAGPVFIYDNNLAATGDMQFDSADINSLKLQGNFGSVILHEMGHILGIGTLWEANGVTGPDASNCPYSGPRANAEYKNITGCNVVPTENDGDVNGGTFCGHWDEECMRSELMTGFLNGGLNPLSRITIATLDDIGYTVDYSSAESYSSNDVTSSCRCGQRSLSDSVNQDQAHQLGTSLKSTRRRSLSVESYQMAVDYGQTILNERQTRTPSKSFTFSGGLNQRTGSTGLTYVGDKVVVVFVEEEGAFFDVTVNLV